MKLGGQDRGYAMAVLLVSMSIAAIMMTVVMPVWKQMVQREKEEELIFRGQQYVHALRLFSRKYANASPPNLDVLLEQRFLRKKFKDPITNDDFQLLLAGQGVPGAPTTQPAAGRGGRSLPPSPLSPSGLAPSPASGPGTPSSQTAPAAGSRFGGGIGGTGSGIGRTGSGIGGGVGGSTGISPIGTPGAGATGGVIGVASKSKDKSIRIYNGRNHYNEWAFVNTPQTQAPGLGGRGTPIPGQRGRQGQPAGTNPFGSGIGGQRGTNPSQPGTTPNQPNPNPRGGPTPFQPAQPIRPGRGRD